MINLILDTDIGDDCDDVGAMGILHALAKRGEADILAETHCYSSENGCAVIDVINRYYNRPDIPVGMQYKAKYAPIDTIYAGVIASEFRHSYQDGRKPEDTTRVLRKALASCKGSATIAAIGPMTSLARLLESHADDISPLDGRGMVAEKCSRLVVMAGNFSEKVTEHNIEVDIDAARKVAEQWPGEIIFCPFELGFPIITGRNLKEKPGRPNPVRRAYELHDDPPGRFSWDLVTVLHAVRPESGYFSMHPHGRIEIDRYGITRWSEKENGRHTYLMPGIPADEIAAIMDELLDELPE